MRNAVLTTLVLALAASAAAQTSAADLMTAQEVGPFFVRDLIERLRADPERFEAERQRVILAAIRYAGEDARRPRRFSLISSFAKSQGQTAERRRSLDARSAWHATYMRMIFRDIRR
ncbi:MAG: hypothetical protein QF664_10025 [Dehalococcoidia bacterium]|jgi:hypothetical protein|nr:hypothetical protein [Dehalococcoidia bacterium]